MNSIIESSEVTAVIQSFLAINEGDESAKDLILAIGAELLDVSSDTMLEMVNLPVQTKEPRPKKILLMFDFQTGDADCPYWTEFAVVYGEWEDLPKIEKLGVNASRHYSAAGEDAEYEDVVKDVLRKSGFRWEYVENCIGNIPSCDMFHRFEI